MLVAGGETASAEMLQLSCGEPTDLGQWALISSLTGTFWPTFLAELNNHILAVGSFSPNIIHFPFVC